MVKTFQEISSKLSDIEENVMKHIANLQNQINIHNDFAILKKIIHLIKFLQIM